MQIDQNAFVTLLVFVATQTGALIFFAGVVTVTLRGHGERLDKNDEWRDRTERTVIQLATREGIEP